MQVINIYKESGIMKKLKANKILNVLLCAVLVAGMLPQVAFAEEPNNSDSEENVVSRIFGATATETATEIARAAYPVGSTCDNVVLAVNSSFYDSMSAAGLAGALHAPILLTDSKKLSAATKTEIETLEAKTVYIIGGEAAIAPDVARAVEGLGCTVQRVFGNDAPATSAACAKELAELKAAGSVSGSVKDEAIIATSSSFHDAVSISGYAYQYKVPIMLQTAGATADVRHLTEDQAEMLLEGAYKDSKVIVAGGTAAVSEESVQTVRDPQTEPYERYAGSDAYDTSLKIAEGLYEGATQVVLATGESDGLGLDALAGAALAGKNGAPMLLVGAKCGNYTTIDNFIEPNKDAIECAYILGGTAAMPKDVSERVCAIFEQEPAV